MLPSRRLTVYPYPLRMIKATPDGRTFFGFFGSTVHVVRLELPGSESGARLNRDNHSFHDNLIC